MKKQSKKLDSLQSQMLVPKTEKIIGGKKWLAKAPPPRSVL
jgi:hypothetical protein